MMIAFIIAVYPARPIMAETRIALVIGINAYQNAPPLINPVNDAKAIGDALRRLNFEVEEIIDPDFRTLSHGLREFGIRAQGADTVVVYYAGHGMQVDHENYLVPADARLERARDVVYETLPLALILDEVSQANKIGIVLLDSCRNNPFGERVARSMRVAGRAVPTIPGLARVDDVPRNTMVAMAARAEQIAEDGQDHSPFAAAILAHLQIPGLELGLFFRSVRDSVLKATQNRQEPYIFSSLGAEPFYFYPRPPNRPPVIGQIPMLTVTNKAPPTPFGIPRPTDPDQDLLTVRIIGLPTSGEVMIEGRRANFGEAFSLDHFMTGTFKPDGTMSGHVGKLDILVEDGRGGSVTGSLPIVVLPPPTPPPTAPAPVAVPAQSAALSAAAGAPPAAHALRPAGPPQATPSASTTKTVAPPPAQTAPAAISPLPPANPPPSPAKTAALPPTPTAPPVATVPPPANPLASSTETAALPTTPVNPPATPTPPPIVPTPSPAKEAPTNLAFASPNLQLTPPTPMSASPLDLLAEARALAVGVPCALLDVRGGQSADKPSRLSVSGPALPGPAFAAFLRHLDGPDGPAVVATDPLDRGLCPALALMMDLVRRNREHGELRLVPQNSVLPVGGHLTVNAWEVPDGEFYADLYAADGTVQHLRHGHITRSQGGADVSITAPISGSPGLRLLVVMATPAPLNLEKRPSSESATDYLPVLKQELDHLPPNAPSEPRAELLPLSIVAALRPPAVAPVASGHIRVPGLRDPRCNEINESVQLGVSLSEADRKVLQTSCVR